MAQWSLGGKVALVTGAGRRVGQAIALELGAAGCRVAVHHHTSRTGAEATVHALRAGGAEAATVRADLSDPAQAQVLVEDVERVLGPPAILVLSAAIFERVPFADLTDELARRMLDLDLLAPMRLARAAAARMVAIGGCIVTILDVGAFQPWRGYAHYCAAKAGLLMLTRCMALELAPNVRVNGVAPGTVLFRDDEDPETRDRIVRHIPLGRVGEPGDVARAVRFLCEGSDFITGVVLPVDGGRALRGGGEP